jgi:hypothetical protein
LQLSLWEKSSVLQAAFTYNTDILERQTVAHMAEQFSFLLATASEQPNIQATELRSILRQNDKAYRSSKDRELQDSLRQKLKSARRKSLVSTSI